MHVFGFVVLAASSSAIRSFLETVFADLCSVWAQDLNLLSALTCFLACVLACIDLYYGQTGQSELRRPKNLHSKALLGALVGMNALPTSQACQALTTPQVSFGSGLEGLYFVVLENITLDCKGELRTVERVEVSLNNTDVSCMSDESVICEDMLRLWDDVSLLLPQESDGVFGGIEPPAEEWKQVLIFIVCFLGIGALVEIFLILLFSRSFTSLLRKREFGGVVRHPESCEPELGQGLLVADPVEPSLPQRVSIFASDNIPMHAKLLVPIFLLVTVAMFIASNTHVGASVEMYVDYQLRPWVPFHHVDPVEKFLGPYYLFQFSLVNTITEMYKAGVYILALLVLVWSGIWPYLKLFLLLVAWFIPPSMLSATVRGRMLLVFDALGKWCMIDIFLMVMMSVAFSFHITSETIPHIHWILPRQSVILDVTVSSKFGMFGFVLAAMLSLVMNHVVLAYHRTATSKEVSQLIEDEVQSISESVLQDSPRAEKTRKRFCCPCPTGSWYGVGSEEVASLDHVLNRKESVITHVFRVKGGNKLRIGWTTQVSVVILLLISMLLIIVGAFTESFEFTFQGLAGKAISIVQPESVVRRYSLITIAQAMNPGNATLAPPNPVGVAFLQSVYLLFAFVMPLVQVIFMLALWLIPMRLRDQKIVFDTTEIVSSWAAMDCFIVSIIAACVEINQFAQFLVGDRCDVLKHFTDEQCFGIKTSFLSGCWVVVAAASILFIASQTVARITERVIMDREIEVLDSDQYDVPERDIPPGLIGNFLWLQ